MHDRSAQSQIKAHAASWISMSRRVLHWMHAMCTQPTPAIQAWSGAHMCSLCSQAETRLRKKRLREVLAQQRGLGHFDASNELGINEASDAAPRSRQQQPAPGA